MRLHRFIGDFKLVPGGQIPSSDPELINQLQNVFRLRSGDSVLLCDGQGKESVASINSLGKKRIVFDLGEIRRIASPPRAVTLYAAILKRENFEWVVEKSTECGVSKVIPILTEHTVKLALNLDRLRKIAREAAEQCGRGEVPEVINAVPFNQAILAARNSGDAVYFCDGDGSELLSRSLVGLAKGRPISIFIGPEGGWNNAERTEAEGFERVSLGGLTLRAETAAVVASFLAAGW